MKISKLLLALPIVAVMVGCASTDGAQEEAPAPEAPAEVAPAPEAPAPAAPEAAAPAIAPIADAKAAWDWSVQNDSGVGTDQVSLKDFELKLSNGSGAKLTVTSDDCKYDAGKSGLVLGRNEVGEGNVKGAKGLFTLTLDMDCTLEITATPGGSPDPAKARFVGAMDASGNKINELSMGWEDRNAKTASVALKAGVYTIGAQGVAIQSIACR